MNNFVDRSSCGIADDVTTVGICVVEIVDVVEDVDEIVGDVVGGIADAVEDVVVGEIVDVVFFDDCCVILDFPGIVGNAFRDNTGDDDPGEGGGVGREDFDGEEDSEFDGEDGTDDNCDNKDDDIDEVGEINGD